MMERRLKPSAKVLSRVRVAEIRANPYQPRARESTKHIWNAMAVTRPRCP